jgi:DNA invertase Pin-like site-specific DNA recombinase
MLVGYMRVSKADGSQVLDLQRDALIAAGVDAAHLYEDKCSGAKDDRPGLAGCLKSLRKGDVLAIWKLDRLGRNLKHLIEVTEDLTKRGVGFKVLQGAPIDTTNSQGKLMFTMFAALAEFERDVTGQGAEGRPEAGLHSL